MKVDAYKSNNTYFTALYMPTKNQATAKVGKYVAQQVELARPELEKLAENVDIFLEPFRYWDGRSGLYISFARLGTHKSKYDLNKCLMGSLFKEDFGQNADIPMTIINTVKELKGKYGGI